MTGTPITELMPTMEPITWIIYMYGISKVNENISDCATINLEKKDDKNFSIQYQ